MESGIVILLMSFIFFGIFQVSQVHMAQEVMINAAAAGARSKAVGFNDIMVYKVVKVATIPNAGRLRNPAPSFVGLPEYTTDRTLISYWERALANPRPGNPNVAAEISAIPLYLGTSNPAGLSGVMDYEDWDSVSWPLATDDGLGVSQVRVAQDFELTFPFSRAFISDGEVGLRSSATHADFGAIFLQ